MVDDRTKLNYQQHSPDTCLICPTSPSPLRPWRSEQDLSSDLRAAAGLHTAWWPSPRVPLDEGALKDSADLMYGYPAEILSCPRCRSLYRPTASIPADIQARYRDDPYPTETLDRLWDRYTRAYQQDREWMLRLLSPNPTGSPGNGHPELLEIGSHVGAFLAHAGAHGWSAHGLDVGAAVTGYAQKRGMDARAKLFSPDDYAPNSLDAVWILNCFEHLPAPTELLLQLATILRPDGRLILRTPRAEGIRALYRSRPRYLAHIALTQDNALGVPFPRCYSEQGLSDLLARTGYHPPQIRRRRLVSVAPDPAGSSLLASLRSRARTAAVGAGLRIWRHLPPGDPHAWMDVSAVRRREHTT